MTINTGEQFKIGAASQESQQACLLSHLVTRGVGRAADVAGEEGVRLDIIGVVEKCPCPPMRPPGPTISPPEITEAAEAECCLCW